MQKTQEAGDSWTCQWPGNVGQAPLPWPLETLGRPQCHGRWKRWAGPNAMAVGNVGQAPMPWPLGKLGRPPWLKPLEMLGRPHG